MTKPLAAMLVFLIKQVNYNYFERISSNMEAMTSIENAVLATPETSGRLSTSVQRFNFWDRLGN